MTCHIVTEGPAEMRLLQLLLKPELDQAKGRARVIEGGGWSGAESLARSIVVVPQEPAALVVDADTTNPARVKEYRRFLEHSLGSVAPHPLWAVYVVVPEVEVLLTQDLGILEALVGGPVSQEQAIRARYEPKAVLAELMTERGISPDEFARRLRKVDLGPLRRVSPIPELREFLARALQAAPA